MLKILLNTGILILMSNLFVTHLGAQNELKKICNDSTSNDVHISIVYYNDKLLLDSTDVIATYRLGMSYYKIKSYTKAIQYFDRLESLDPNFYELYTNRGLCKLLSSDEAGACKDFSICVQNDYDPEIINGMKLSAWMKDNCF